MPVLRFDHWRDVPGDEWAWAHFSPQEMACPGSSALIVDTKLLNLLSCMRRTWGRMIVTSGYRSPASNGRVGGVTNSLHTKGEAVDIAVQAFKQEEFIALAEACGAGGIGRYPDRGFVHIDVGEDGRRWVKEGRR